MRLDRWAPSPISTMSFDLDWAFAQYELVRNVLPGAQFPPRSKTIGHILDLVDELDVFLLDGFGVLNIGESVISGAPEWVAELKSAGKQVFVVTNGASFPVEIALEKYHRMGFDFAPNDVVASRDALVLGLKNRPEKVWGVMADAGARLEQLAVETVLLGDDLSLYERVDGFVLLGSGGWSRGRQNLLRKSCKNRPRPVLVGNPDLVAPREDGLSLEPGWYGHELSRITTVAPEFYGKPYANVFDLALSRVKGDIAARRIGIAGDTLHTDIVGGAAAGLKTILVSGHGLFAGRDVTAFIRKSGIVPDWII